MADRLSGKVAVVTGASSGIGEATVLALAAEGAAVAAGARRKIQGPRRCTPALEEDSVANSWMSL